VSEIRQNKATKQWVIYAPARRKRPQDFQQPHKEHKSLPVFDQTCPFCPGNEHMLASIVQEIPDQGQDPWQTRVIPNKFPALTPKGGTERLTQGIYLAMPGYGQHEVIIESPYHNRDLAQMPTDEVSRVIETYHQRYVDLMQAHQNMMTLIFRNHGAQAGASLSHPHSQVIVTPIVPQYIRWREEEAQRYFDDWGRCVFCDILAFEMQDRQRVILENQSFVAFVPFAAEVPFEIWIMPKQHQASFSHLSDTEKSDLTLALHQVLVKLCQKLQDPDYNYIIHSAAQYRAREPQLHWYLQIRPRLTTPAGFEIGSGICINPSIPEEDAQFLHNGVSSG
jgi:UDPglucose--hexose-1-phosphate uridylyltransferase